MTVVDGRLTGRRVRRVRVPCRRARWLVESRPLARRPSRHRRIACEPLRCRPAAQLLIEPGGCGRLQRAGSCRWRWWRWRSLLCHPALRWGRRWRHPTREWVRVGRVRGRRRWPLRRRWERWLVLPIGRPVRGRCTPGRSHRRRPLLLDLDQRLLVDEPDAGADVELVAVHADAFAPAELVRRVRLAYQFARPFGGLPARVPDERVLARSAAVHDANIVNGPVRLDLGANFRRRYPARQRPNVDSR